MSIKAVIGFTPCWSDRCCHDGRCLSLQTGGKVVNRSGGGLVALRRGVQRALLVSPADDAARGHHSNSSMARVEVFSLAADGVLECPGGAEAPGPAGSLVEGGPPTLAGLPRWWQHSAATMRDNPTKERS